jgi:UDP-2,3-diacylglucosamine hydrolase
MRDDDLLFVSDLHLDAALPAAIGQFMRFLEGPARQAAGLYILGDLFESWVGDDDDDPARDGVCRALRAYSAGGRSLWVLRGNRDFLMGTGFEARTGATLLPDPFHLRYGALSAFVCHGDLLCTGDHPYQELRSLVRQPALQARYLRLPLAARRSLADSVRRGSQAHTGRQQAALMDVDAQAVEAAFRCSAARLLIHGHTHRPGVHPGHIDGRDVTRIVLGDWYHQGSCLRLQANGGYELLALPR